MSDGYTLADLQRMKEEIQIGYRLDAVAREHRMRQLLGDDVYDIVSSASTVDPFTLAWDPDAMHQADGETDAP